MTYSIIQKSQLEDAQRMDAEYFMPTFLHISSALEKLPTKSLDSLTDITASAFYPAATEFYSDTDGLPFIRGVDIVNYPIITEDQLFERLPVDFLSQHKNIKILKRGDIVISKVGTPCYASIINGELEKVALSRTVLGLRSIKNVNIYYLLAFLRSKYGFDQLEREIELQIQEQLTLERVRKIKIYTPSLNGQKEIALLIKAFYEGERDSKKLYSRAEELLLEELGLKDFQVEEDLSFVAELSNVKNAGRIDAEFFQPKYKKLISKLALKAVNKLEDFVKDYSTGFPFKSENYQEKGIHLIRINNIRKGFIDLSNAAYLSNKDYLLSPKDTAKPRDIVLSMSGTIGISALIPSDVTKCIINQRILRFTSKGIDNDYLVLVLNSIVGLYQLERVATGGVQTNISYKDIRNILIPDLPKETQRKIADLVRKSHKARKKSKELLEEAKRKVEEMIEKSGKK